MTSGKGLTSIPNHGSEILLVTLETTIAEMDPKTSNIFQKIAQKALKYKPKLSILNIQI